MLQYIVLRLILSRKTFGIFLKMIDILVKRITYYIWLMMLMENTLCIQEKGEIHRQVYRNRKQMWRITSNIRMNTHFLSCFISVSSHTKLHFLLLLLLLLWYMFVKTHVDIKTLCSLKKKKKKFSGFSPILWSTVLIRRCACNIFGVTAQKPHKIPETIT